MRAVIYARYSSDNQSDSSIEDQVRQCRRRIEQEGWSLSEVYSDAAISGATTQRHYDHARMIGSGPPEQRGDHGPPRPLQG